MQKSASQLDTFRTSSPTSVAFLQMVILDPSLLQLWLQVQTGLGLSRRSQLHVNYYLLLIAEEYAALSVRSQTSWSPSVLFKKGFALLCQVKYFFMFLCYLLDNYLPCPLQESYLRLRPGASVSLIQKAFFACSQGEQLSLALLFQILEPQFLLPESGSAEPRQSWSSRFLWLLQCRGGTFISLVSLSGKPLRRMLCSSMRGNLLLFA